MTAAWRRTFYAFEYVDGEKVLFTITREAYDEMPAYVIADALEQWGAPPIPPEVVNPPPPPRVEWRPLPLDELIAILDGEPDRRSP
jgi:hypothetical protein